MKKEDIADLVIKDIKKRKIMGKKKYGRPLQANNGRDALQDLYEELIDATQYCKQEMIERDTPAEIELEYLLSLEVARAVLKHYKKKSKNTLLVSFEGWIEKELTKLQ